MKLQKIIIGILILGILGVCILLVFDKRNIIKEKNNLKDEVKSLKEELNIEKQKQDTKNSDIVEDTKECTYTKTYFFIDYYDYQGDVPSEKYIIVDQFQDHAPKIIKYSTNMFDIDFEKGANYEFTFKSGIRNGIIEDDWLINIEKTDKLGMEQVEESCVIR